MPLKSSHMAFKLAQRVLNFLSYIVHSFRAILSFFFIMPFINFKRITFELTTFYSYDTTFHRFLMPNRFATISPTSLPYSKTGLNYLDPIS